MNKLKQELNVSVSSTPVDSVHSRNGADQALDLVDGAYEPDVLEEKNVLKKIDFHILPWLCSMYFCQYLDKQALSYAAIMGILEDCNLQGRDYAWTSSIYYAAYLVAAYPHNRLMQQFPECKYVAFFGVLWGMTLMCMAACNSFASLMVVRALMGVFEAPTTGGLVLITSKWYKSNEQSSRTGFWFASVGVASMLGSILAFSAYRGELQTHVKMHSWKILCLGIGAFTICWGILMFIFMDNSIITARFLNREEKRVAIERLRTNNQGIGTKVFKWPQFWEAILDYRTWMYFCLMATSQIPVAGIQSFASQMLKSYGWGVDVSLLLQTLPSGFLQIISSLGFGYIGSRYKNKSLACFGAMIVSLFGMALMIGLQDVSSLYKKSGQLVAYIILVGNSATPFAVICAMASSNVAGHTKKTTTNGLLFLSMAFAYFIGPQVFDDGPYYHKAKVVSLTLWAVCLILCILNVALNKWENTNRDKFIEKNNIEKVENSEFMDLTDKKNPYFRYSY
ncbi:uncharacterized protein PRCAT00005130001 [Priceomyces carsonii]|uniref:uncharacterized protein n=1 Tax=Priceomyces carsonii TaxID=28549 RepID=UPI002ED8E55B|nr:unnamed protein product [Priceomyces carsonii]